MTFQNNKKQEHRIKPLEELTLMDDYMFSVVMSNPENMKPLLEYILGVKISRIELIESEKMEKEGYESHGIRMDLYVMTDDGQIYDVEVQTSDKANLPKRMRYYQSVIDINILSPGIDYKNLRKSYVLFLCNYDPFGQKRYIYTFENRCLEDLTLTFGDETVKIIVNTKGSTGEISEELKELIDYLDKGLVGGAYTKQLDDAVKSVRSSEKRRREYMIAKIHEMEIREEGREEGRKEGREEGVDQSRIDSIKSLMNTLKLTAQQAMEALSIPLSEQSRYLTKL